MLQKCIFCVNLSSIPHNHSQSKTNFLLAKYARKLGHNSMSALEMLCWCKILGWIYTSLTQEPVTYHKLVGIITTKQNLWGRNPKEKENVEWYIFICDVAIFIFTVSVLIDEFWMYF